MTTETENQNPKPRYPIFSRPEPEVQRPVSSNARDRKGFKRSFHGGVVREKGKRN